LLGEAGRLFVIGGSFGLFCAVLGAFVDYLLMRRRSRDENGRFPGCILLMAGGLSIVGLLVIGVSFLLTGTIFPSLIVGAGVIVGFSCGFGVLLATSLLISSRRSDFLE
jgi:protein-S-isoprenylcysteine O-methyltransferase Ste14